MTTLVAGILATAVVGDSLVGALVGLEPVPRREEHGRVGVGLGEEEQRVEDLQRARSVGPAVTAAAGGHSAARARGVLDAGRCQYASSPTSSTTAHRSSAAVSGRSASALRRACAELVDLAGEVAERARAAGRFPRRGRLQRRPGRRGGRQLLHDARLTYRSGRFSRPPRRAPSTCPGARTRST